MKKSSFVAMILGTVSGILFALGMCMTLISEWDAFLQGIILGCIGILLGLITLIVWRKMEHKAPIRISGKQVLTIAVGTIGVLSFGAGMCFGMVWENMIAGIIIGIVGILLLLSLIPLTKVSKSEYSTKIDRTTYKNNGWKKGYQRTTLSYGAICCC